MQQRGCAHGSFVFVRLLLLLLLRRIIFFVCRGVTELK